MKSIDRYLKVALVILATMMASKSTLFPQTIYWLLVTVYWIINIVKDIDGDEDE